MDNVIKRIEETENLINKYQDLIGSEANNFKYDNDLDSSEVIRKTLNEIENNDRLLQIGIVGRVKTGKSSLLNALLFNGKSILPTAASPMTAALTTLTYGEIPVAEVEFFSEDDIKNISEKSAEYLARLEKIAEDKFNVDRKNKEKNNHNLTKDEILTLQLKAKHTAEKELRENLVLDAAFTQYKSILDSSEQKNKFIENQTFSASNIDDLSKMLLDYVSVNGKYMPFTKAVHLKLPLENMKDLRIIDTPGLNDVVRSREMRTRELLKVCDMVLIVSPTGQFLSAEDLELMDRITTKEGIRELFVIASMIDYQLFGSEKVRYNGDLHSVISGITASLGEQMHSILSQLKSRNPEVGDTFDQLIEQGKEKVIHSSGICQSIKVNFEKKDQWTDGLAKTWENLTKNYPDYFSDSDTTLSFSNLDLLANTTYINKYITEVRDKKDKIMLKRKEDFIRAKSSSFYEFLNELKSFVVEQSNRIKESNIEELKKKKQAFEKSQKKAALLLDDEYTDIVDELNKDLYGELSHKLDSYFTETKKDVDSAEQTTTETYQVDKGRGFLFWRSITGNRYETHTRTIPSVRTGAVRDALESLTYEIEKTISTKAQEYFSQWKKNLNSSLIKILRDCIGDDNLDPLLIKSSIREVFSSIKYPELIYREFSFNDSLKKVSGSVTGSEAEKYLDEAKNHINGLKHKVNQDIKDYLKNLTDSLKKHDISTKVLGDYNSKIANLEEQIKNKKTTIARFEKLLKELEGV